MPQPLMLKKLKVFHQNLQDFLEITTAKKRCPSHHRGLDTKVQSQEISKVTGKFGLGVHNEVGQRLTEFCQENVLVIANTLFQQQKKETLHMDITRWSLPNSD